MYEMRIGSAEMGRNGFMNQVMQHHEDFDNLVKDFEDAIAAGYNPNNVKDTLFKKNNLTEDELSIRERETLIRKVEAAYSASNGGYYI